MFLHSSVSAQKTYVNKKKSFDQHYFCCSFVFQRILPRAKTNAKRSFLKLTIPQSFPTTLEKTITGREKTLLTEIDTINATFSAAHHWLNCELVQSNSPVLLPCYPGEEDPTPLTLSTCERVATHALKLQCLGLPNAQANQLLWNPEFRAADCPGSVSHRSDQKALQKKELQKFVCL